MDWRTIGLMVALVYAIIAILILAACSNQDSACYYIPSSQDMAGRDSDECFYQPRGPEGCVPIQCER